MPINLAWTANDAGDNVTGYKLYWGSASGNYNGGNSPISVGNVTTYSFTSSAGRIYFALKATNAAGDSSLSAEVVNIQLPSALRPVTMM